MYWRSSEYQGPQLTDQILCSIARTVRRQGLIGGARVRTSLGSKFFQTKYTAPAAAGGWRCYSATGVEPSNLSSTTVVS